jgi:hypothetical protein
MRRTTASVLAVSGLMALLAPGCGGGTQSTGGTSEMKDSEVRLYIEQKLQPHLDSLTKAVCAELDRENQPKTWLCDPDHDDYTKPPTNGKP